MNEKTKNILNFDPIANAENLLSKRYENWDPQTDAKVGIGFTNAINKIKKKHLESIGDTYFGISWKDFVKIVKAYGFKCGYCQNFTGTGWSSDKSIEEEEIIFFHEEKGLILHAVSFDGKSVNTATVYGEVKIADKPEEKQWEALNGCSHGSNGNGTMHFEVDVREGFRFHLDAISEAFEFSKNWSEVPFLWFLNYMDSKVENYDFKKITNQKINASTSEVKKIIFGC